MTRCFERRILEIQYNLTTLWNNLFCIYASGSAAPNRGLLIPSQPLKSAPPNRGLLIPSQPLKSEGENRRKITAEGIIHV